MMKFNETQKIILKTLFLKNRCLRKELAESASISLPALTLSLKKLFDNGIIISNKNPDGKVGRNTELISLNEKYGDFLSLDIRKRHISIVLTDFGGNILLNNEYLLNTEITKIIIDIISSHRVLEASVIYRHHPKEEEIKEKYSYVLSPLVEKNIPLCFFNNVEALGLVYELHHTENHSFLLLKYGPGLGSSIFVNGKLIRSESHENSEIGHVYLQDGSKLEDKVSYDKLFSEGISEKDGYQKLLEDPAKLNEVSALLALAITDADGFLSLDEIVLTGIFLSNDKIRNDVENRILKLNPEFNKSKITLFPDYSKANVLKGPSLAFIKYISSK